MATDLNELRDSLNVQTGKTLTSEELDELLVEAVPVYNAEASSTFTLNGMVLDRDATDLEKRALVLLAVEVYLDRKVIEWSLKAVSHSNVAGKTDLSSIEWALSKRRAENREKKIDPLMARIRSLGVISEVVAEELSESADYNPHIWDYSSLA